MGNSLEERLRTNSNAFDGLLSLIPAKYYYDENTQNQWKAKKKSRAEYRADKAKKLDPEGQNDDSSTALELMVKRSADAKPVVLPGERARLAREIQTSQDIEDLGEDSSNEEEEEEEEEVSVVFDDNGDIIEDSSSSSSPLHEDKEEQSKKENKDKNKKEKNGKSSKKEQLSEEDKLKREKNLELLRERLQAKIQAMKEKRKAVGTNVEGAPTSREAILQQRQRRAELKRKRMEEEQQGQGSGNNNKVDSGSSGSESSENEETSDMEDGHSGSLRNKLRKITADDVMYQSIEFDDGAKVTSDLQRIRKAKGKKGPAKNDIAAHLKLLQARKDKIASKDELEQIKLKKKEKWQRSILQAEGIKLKDDEKLLKKSLKRKEAKKRKSAIEWRERNRAVDQAKAEKAKRREENLQIRKQNKGLKKSKQQKMKKKVSGKAIIPKKKRAGFEGRLKSARGGK